MTTITSTKTATASAPTMLASATTAAVGSAAYITSQFFLADLTDREAMASTFLVVTNAVVALAFLALALQLPTAPGLRGLPGWALAVSALGLAFVGALAWGLATIGAASAGLMTDAQFASADGDIVFMLAFIPKMILCAVGLSALALVRWQRGTIAKRTCVVLGLAALASLLPPYPPGALLAAIGLAWAVRSATPVAVPSSADGRE